MYKEIGSLKVPKDFVFLEGLSHAGHCERLTFLNRRTALLPPFPSLPSNPFPRPCFYSTLSFLGPAAPLRLSWLLSSSLPHDLFLQLTVLVVPVCCACLPSSAPCLAASSAYSAHLAASALSLAVSWHHSSADWPDFRLRWPLPEPAASPVLDGPRSCSAASSAPFPPSDGASVTLRPSAGASVRSRRSADTFARSRLSFVASACLCSSTGTFSVPFSLHYSMRTLCWRKLVGQLVQFSVLVVQMLLELKNQLHSQSKPPFISNPPTSIFLDFQPPSRHTSLDLPSHGSPCTFIETQGAQHMICKLIKDLMDITLRRWLAHLEPRTSTVSSVLGCYGLDEIREIVTGLGLQALRFVD
ncbi:hypothetical protein KSP40_PGU011097 [Platanthera guangdongensis]|uniref:Uncharacterized protein n=1 Tax=Platanthera guangdongensis TaxID=2320717 RepID=A0ABR2M0X9_9ASPA